MFYSSSPGKKIHRQTRVCECERINLFINGIDGRERDGQETGNFVITSASFARGFSRFTLRVRIGPCMARIVRDCGNFRGLKDAVGLHVSTVRFRATTPPKYLRLGG